jgi:hypothetical protein
MCIPGSGDDCDDDWWCVYDMRRRRTRLVVGVGMLHDQALQAATDLNRRRRSRRDPRRETR